MLKKLTGKTMVITVVLCLAAALVAGCAQKAPEKSGTVTLTGSTSVQPLADMLGQSYEDANPGVKINIAGGGSGVGIKAADDGTTDIGTSSRELKEEEKHLHETVIAKDGIAIVVHPSNPVTGLTIEQVKKIYTGEYTNWQEVGGADAEIVVIGREASSGTRGAFEELVLGKDAQMIEAALIQPSTGAVKTTVAGDEKAIGYISAGSISSDVKAMAIEGIECTNANIKSGTYKISRPFLFVTKAAPEGLVKDFIDFVLSEAGQDIVAEEGYVTIN